MRHMLFILTFLAAAAASAKAGQPVYAVRELPEVAITRINAKTKRISVKLPDGSQALSAGSKTWIIKDGDEASFSDLQVGQRLHVWYIPRGGEAIILEVLQSKDKK